MRYVFLSAILSTSAWAATNSCPGLQTSGNLGYPVAGPNNLVYDTAVPSTTTFTGCQVVNVVFSNWTTANTGGTYIGSAVTATQPNDPIVTEPTFRLATERGNFSVATDKDNNDGNNNWSTTNTSSFLGGTVDFVATTTGGSVYDISFVFNSVTHGAAGTVGITPIFCLGGTVTGTFSAAACSSGGGIAFSPGLTNITGNGIQSLNFVLPSASTRVAVSFAVNIAAGSTGTTGFNYVDLNFMESPEPTTFYLFGSGVVLLACLRLRAKLPDHRS